ncbi:PucR family transcriptional regulator [Blautia sp.]|uniref:PucR family transcriptional regulator n=1 Tax=Blautia sp. TaxID=1955243 RepID=UPI003A24189F
MKISMWNLYHALSYPELVPLIKDGSPTITCARWMVTTRLNSNAVYVGKQSEFFDTADNSNAIIVHRYDWILVKNVDTEELFNEVNDILENYSNWEKRLEGCLEEEDGIQKMLDASHDFLPYPACIYAPDGKFLAFTYQYESIDNWCWTQMSRDHFVSEDTFRKLKRTIHLTSIFQDVVSTRHDAERKPTQFIHCSLVVHGFSVGHFVIFNYLSPFKEGLEYIMDNLVRWMNRYIESHYEYFNNSSLYADVILPMLQRQEYNEAKINGLLEYLNWKPEDQFQFYVFAENVEEVPVLLAKVYRKLSEQLSSAVTLIMDEKLVVLEDKMRLQGNTSVETLLPQILDDGFVCGASNVFRGLGRCHIYCQQAEEELLYARKTQSRISYACKHGLEHFQKILRRDTLAESYIDQTFLYLKEYDRRHETSYYETMKAYCISCFHMSDTAQMLSIHRNSLSYRLDRIRELIDFSGFDELITSKDADKINVLALTFLYIDNIL